MTGFYEHQIQAGEMQVRADVHVLPGNHSSGAESRMHGRKKSDQKSKSEAEKEALKAKVANYQQLAQLALSRRKTGKGLSL